VLDGNVFHYAADADPNYGKPQFKNTPMPTTGGTMKQMVLQDRGSEGHKIKANADELALLRELNDREDNFPISWFNRAGDCYTCVGFIDFDPQSAQNGTVDVKVYPEDDWAEFIA
jgi:hypothetical protein